MSKRILLSDGSGLTSRQVATILAQKGHEVHVLCPPGLSLTKTTRWVTRTHNITPFGPSPHTWLREAIEIVKDNNIDILIPTQEQVAVLSAEAELLRTLGVGFAVPSFNSLRKVLDKVSAYNTLTEVELRQPTSVTVNSAENLQSQVKLLPCFVKMPIGTASRGVLSAKTTEDLVRIAQDYDSYGCFQDGGQILVQRAVAGPLLMIQSVFSHGKLLSWHSCLRAREGPSGGATNKISLPIPLVKEDLIKLGAFLDWHGALSMDAILVDGLPHYIDVNPRIVEPTNALYSGVDLVESMLQISMPDSTSHFSQQAHNSIIPQSDSQADIRTHQLLLGIFKAIELGRISLLLEVLKAVRGLDEYANSREELTPIRDDPFSFLFLTILIMVLLIGGNRVVRSLTKQNVGSYALTPKGWQEILQTENKKR